MAVQSRRWYERAAVIALLIIGVLTFVFGVSVLFVEDSLVDSLTVDVEPLRAEMETFEHDTNVLIATFSPGMALFGSAITLIPLGKGERWAWVVMWYYPVFFLLHVGLLGTVIPDLPLAAISVLALVALAPRTWPRRSEGTPTKESSAQHG